MDLIASLIILVIYESNKYLFLPFRVSLHGQMCLKCAHFTVGFGITEKCSEISIYRNRSKIRQRCLSIM